MRIVLKTFFTFGSSSVEPFCGRFAGGHRTGDDYVVFLVAFETEYLEGDGTLFTR